MLSSVLGNLYLNDIRENLTLKLKMYLLPTRDGVIIHAAPCVNEYSIFYI